MTFRFQAIWGQRFRPGATAAGIAETVGPQAGLASGGICDPQCQLAFVGWAAGSLCPAVDGIMTPLSAWGSTRGRRPLMLLLGLSLFPYVVAMGFARWRLWVSAAGQHKNWGEFSERHCPGVKYFTDIVQPLQPSRAGGPSHGLYGYGPGGGLAQNSHQAMANFSVPWAYPGYHHCHHRLLLAQFGLHRLDRGHDRSGSALAIAQQRATWPVG